MPSSSACPFCTFVLPGRDRPFLASSELSVAFEDAYPSAPGHILVVPRRHVGHLLELSDAESDDLWRLARSQLSRLAVAGSGDFTLGVNDGPLAGQSVPHVHLHVIPRTAGDVPDPRGGLRWVLPGTAPYWEWPAR